MFEMNVACLALVLFGEAATHEQKLAVGAVVMNRAGHKVEKICDVVYAPKQFEYITLIQQNKMREPTREELLKHELLALQIIKKQHVNPVANSKFFHDTRISNPWKNKQQVAVIGNMIFY